MSDLTPQERTLVLGSHFHGTRVDATVTVYSLEHPEGQVLDAPPEGACEVRHCAEHDGDFYVIAGSRPTPYCRQCAYDVEGRELAASAADWIAALSSVPGAGAPTVHHTGGGCMALRLEVGEHHLLVTDGDADVPGPGTTLAYIGLYDADGGGDNCREATLDTVAEVAAALIAEVA